MSSDRFWETLPVEQFSGEQWEAICDGCARCCLHVLEDEDDGRRYQTNVCCQYLDLESCRCTEYQRRTQLVPSCVKLTPDNYKQIDFLPATCAYRYLAEQKTLPAWHPLLSGDAQSVHRAGISIQMWATPESEAGDLEEHIIDSLPE